MSKRFTFPLVLLHCNVIVPISFQGLFCKVRAILGKLTPQNFQALTQQMIELDIDTQECFEGFVDLIYEKVILQCVTNDVNKYYVL